MTYNNIFIGVGSNIKPEKNIPKALLSISEKCVVTNVSTFFETKPVGLINQDNFYNGVFKISSDFEPLELKHSLRAIEADLGRVRTLDKFSPRIIDLDIVIFEDFILDSEDLVLPDPDIFERPFIALPLLELAPELRLPPEGISLQTVAEEKNWNNVDDMLELKQFTESLRELI